MDIQKCLTIVIVKWIFSTIMNGFLNEVKCLILGKLLEVVNQIACKSLMHSFTLMKHWWQAYVPATQYLKVIPLIRCRTTNCGVIKEYMALKMALKIRSSTYQFLFVFCKSHSCIPISPRFERSWLPSPSPPRGMKWKSSSKDELPFFLVLLLLTDYKPN